MKAALDGAEAYSLRVRRFDRIASRFNCRRPCELVAVHRLDPAINEALKLATKVYLSRVLQAEHPILDEEEILGLLQDRRESLRNVTPTGMILPKRYSTVEYNHLMGAFYRAVDSLGFGDLIHNWQIPMHIRLKYPQATGDNLNRPRHAPEERHIDSWSGYSTCGVTFIVPLLGDTINNSVEFWRLKDPRTFREEWLVHQFDKTKEHAIAEFYEPVDFQLQPGEVFMFEAAALHATRRTADCGIRVSIDNIFTPFLGLDEAAIEVVSDQRRAEQLTHAELVEIGAGLLFLFPDADEDRRDTQGGTRDPITFELRKY